MTPFTWLAAGSAFALVIVVGIWQVQVSRMEAAHFRAISAEQQKTRTVQATFDSYKLEVEQTITNQERIRADENANALNEREAMAAEIDRLRGVAAVATRQRNEATNNFLKALQNVPQTDVSPLAGAVLAYLDGVRRQQSASGAPSN